MPRLPTRAAAFLLVVLFDRAPIHPRTARSRGRANDAPPPPDPLQPIDGEGYGGNRTAVRISFRLHDPVSNPFYGLYVGGHDCPFGENRTGRLPSALQMTGGGGRVLDFTATLSTDLKILQMGDSVTMQLTQAMDEMFGAQELKSRQELWEAYPGNEGGTLVAPTNGGGMHGAWRITALLSQASQGMASTKNKPGGGWNYDKVWPFLVQLPLEQITERGLEHDDIMRHKLDVVVFRVQHGWMKAEEITRERVAEAAEMANRLFRADTIVFQTVPFTNNVGNDTIYEAVVEINEMIRDVARTWHEAHNTTVLVLDLANYFNHVIWTNARDIGYDVSAPLGADARVFVEEGPTFLQERLNQTIWPPSISMVCAKRPPPESAGAYCERNFLSNDGMHMCMNTIAARVGAGLACLLGCVYNRKEDGSDSPLSNVTRRANVRACERRCNEQFLSVMPLRESWINKEGASEITLASFSD